MRRKNLWPAGMAASVAALLPGVALAVQAPVVTVQAPVVTEHRGVFHGVPLAYSVTIDGIDVPEPGGQGGAHVVSFAYQREHVPIAARPVVFLFNGGPITASLWIHLGAFAPRRVEAPSDLAAGADAFHVVDNPQSLIDAADLVFVDPADTGFSRRLPGTAPDAYHSVQADGQQIAGFIQRWLVAHGRLGSPVYLVGESYGTVRAPEVIGQLAALPQPVLVDGVMLLGQAVNIVEYAQRPANIMSYVVSLPTLAAIAWYHGKVDRAGRSFDQFLAEARHYAGTTYLAALYQGSDLPADQRAAVAAALDRYSGIPAAYYRAHDLRISKEQFRTALLADRHLVMGRNDARYVGPLTAKPGDPSEVIETGFEKAWDSYLHGELKVGWPEPYAPMADIKGFDDWGWSGSSPFSPFAYAKPITQLMAKNPRFRVLIGNGYYDTQTTTGAADYLRSQSGWPADRVALRYYEGGHMAYTVDASAVRMAGDLRALVAGQPMVSLPEGQK